VHATRGSAAVESQVALDATTLSALENLAAAGRRYLVRVGPAAVASAPARAVLAAGAADDVTVHVDVATGAAVGVAYVPRRGFGGGGAGATPTAWATVASVVGASDGARPAFEPIVESEKKAKGEAEPGFLRKYWMYIVPAVLVLQLLFAPPPEEAPASGGAGGGGGGGGAAR
jgi:hypothetical protein